MGFFDYPCSEYRKEFKTFEETKKITYLNYQDNGIYSTQLRDYKKQLIIITNTFNYKKYEKINNFIKSFNKENNIFEIYSFQNNYIDIWNNNFIYKIKIKLKEKYNFLYNKCFFDFDFISEIDIDENYYNFIEELINTFLSQEIEIKKMSLKEYLLEVKKYTLKDIYKCTNLED